MSFLDRIFRRQAQPAQRRRSFDAATGGRRGASFRSFGPTGSETLAAAAPLRSRARHAASNNGYIANAVGAIVGEAVGAGIEPTSAHPDPALRPALDAAWNAFARVADMEGRTDLRGLLAEGVRACVVDGEAFLHTTDTEDGSRGRLIPAEMVDESLTRDLGNGRYIVAGVEFDAQGRRVAYHVQPHRPTELFPTAGEPIRIPAEDMLHLMRPLGPGQVRGVSWLAPVLLTVSELDALMDALLVGAKVAALHCGFIRDLNNVGGSTFDDADAGEVSLEPGALRRLAPGEDVTFSSPTEAKDSVAFARLILGQIAAGIGVPQHLMDGDLSNASYSSLRAGLLPFRQRIEQFQYHQIVPQVLDPLWRRVITREYLAGRLDLPDLEPAFVVEWLMPRPMQVDPLKDTQALIAQMDRGLVSRRQAVASFGWSIDDLDTEIAADRDREAALGLNFTKESSDAG